MVLRIVRVVAKASSRHTDETLRKMEKHLMRTLDEVLAKVQVNQDALDALQAFVAEKDVAQEAQIATLAEKNAELQAVIDAGGLSPEDQAKLESIHTGLEVLEADIKGSMSTPAPEVPEEELPEPGAPGPIVTDTPGAPSAEPIE